MDDYRHTFDSKVLEGEVEQGKVYLEKDFNKEKWRQEKKKRVMLFLKGTQKKKQLFFVQNQSHALMIRDLINQMPSYVKNEVIILIQ